MLISINFERVDIISNFYAIGKWIKRIWIQIWKWWWTFSTIKISGFKEQQYTFNSLNPLHSHLICFFLQTKKSHESASGCIFWNVRTSHEKILTEIKKRQDSGQFCYQDQHGICFLSNRDCFRKHFLMINRRQDSGHYYYQDQHDICFISNRDCFWKRFLMINRKTRFS